MTPGSAAQLEVSRAIPTSIWRQSWLPALVIFFAALAVYYPVHHYPFLHLDDNAYVYENPHVLGPLNISALVWAFTHPFVSNYDPLTFLSHSLDVRMFGLNAGLHHDVNVALHMLNAVLLFWVLKRATGFTGRSLMVAALFAVHPINVENVAWVSERKTLLSTVFLFLALDAYRWYASDPKRRRMLVVAALYVLGLLAKPQVITLPCLLLLWDYWPLKRIAFRSSLFAFRQTRQHGHSGEERRATGEQRNANSRLLSLLWEKWLLFVVAAVDSILTVLAQHETNVHKWPYTLSVRIQNAVFSYAQYLGKAVWPKHLAMQYLYPGNALTIWQTVGALLLLLAISALVILGRQHRYLMVGWLWFLGSLVPMIGLVVQPDLEALADRYAYISFVGLYLMLCWGAAELAQHWHVPAPVLPISAAVVLSALTLMAHRQVAYWESAEALWTHTIEVTHRNWFAETNLGGLAAGRGSYQEALQHFSRAAEDAPDNRVVNLSIAAAESHLGNMPEAIRYYRRAIALSDEGQNNSQVWIDMAYAYKTLGDTVSANQCYREAARMHEGVPAPVPVIIHWRGQWWRDLGPYLRWRWYQWRVSASQ